MRQASNHYKRVLEAAKLAYANKRKEFITSQRLGSLDFWWIANSVLNKGNLAIPSLFNNREVLLSAYDKTKQIFLRTLNLMTQVSLYLVPLLELICIMTVPISTGIVISYAMNMETTSFVIWVMHIYVKLSDELLDWWG